MNTRYFIGRPRTNDSHAVHREGCPFLNDDEENAYAGRFDSSHQALLAVQMQYTKVHCCPFCSKEEKPVRFLTDFVPLKEKIPVLYIESMLCCVN